MARSTVVTSLVDKEIIVRPDFGLVTDPESANSRFWSGLQPSADGVFTARIRAVWVDANDNVIYFVVDPFGNTKEIVAKFVRLSPQNSFAEGK